MQEKDKIIKPNSPLYEEFAIDELPDDLTYDEDSDPCTHDKEDCDSWTHDKEDCDCWRPDKKDCVPCTSVDADCCGTSPIPIRLEPCEISDTKDIKTELTCQGRLVTVRVILKCVCPNKKIAVGVLLFEGSKVRGFEVKEITTPPLPSSHPGENCEHVVVCKFCFVLPGSLCCHLKLKSKVIAHYTDFNIEQCSNICPNDLPKKCCP